LDLFSPVEQKAVIIVSEMHINLILL